MPATQHFFRSRNSVRFRAKDQPRLAPHGLPCCTIFGVVPTFLKSKYFICTIKSVGAAGLTLDMMARNHTSLRETFMMWTFAAQHE